MAIDTTPTVRGTAPMGTAKIVAPAKEVAKETGTLASMAQSVFSAVTSLPTLAGAAAGAAVAAAGSTLSAAWKAGLLGIDAARQAWAVGELDAALGDPDLADRMDALNFLQVTANGTNPAARDRVVAAVGSSAAVVDKLAGLVAQAPENVPAVELLTHVAIASPALPESPRGQAEVAKVMAGDDEALKNHVWKVIMNSPSMGDALLDAMWKHVGGATAAAQAGALNQARFLANQPNMSTIPPEVVQKVLDRLDAAGVTMTPVFVVALREQGSRHRAYRPEHQRPARTPGATDG